MAGNPMIRCFFYKRRLCLRAYACGIRASRMETAALWDIRGTWNFPFQNDSFPLLSSCKDRDCRKEGLGVRVLGMAEKLLIICKLNDFTKIHHNDSVGYVFNHIKGVGNE